MVGGSARPLRMAKARSSQSTASSGVRKYSRSKFPSCVIVRETAPRSRVVPTETRHPNERILPIAPGTPESIKATGSIVLPLSLMPSSPPTVVLS